MNDRTDSLRKYRDYAIPALAVAETILTEGKSPGSIAMAQQQALDRRINESRQDKLDEEERARKLSEDKALSEQRALQNRLTKYNLDKTMIADEESLVQKQKNELSNDDAISLAMEHVAKLGAKDKNFIDNGYKAQMEMAIAKKDVNGAMKVLNDYTKSREMLGKGTGGFKGKYGVQLGISSPELQNSIRETIKAMRDVGYNSAAMDLIESQNDADYRLSASLAEKLTADLMKPENARFVKMAAIKGEGAMLPTVTKIKEAEATAAAVGKTAQKTGELSDSQMKSMNLAADGYTASMMLLNYLDRADADPKSLFKTISKFANPAMYMSMMDLSDIQSRIRSGAAVTDAEMRNFQQSLFNPGGLLASPNWKAILRRRLNQSANTFRNTGNYIMGAKGTDRDKWINDFTTNDFNIPGLGLSAVQYDEYGKAPRMVTSEMVSSKQYSRANEALRDASATLDEKLQAKKIIQQYEYQLKMAGRK